MHTYDQFSRYRIVPIREDFLSQARFGGIDDLRQPVERLIAKGGEPCRDALRRAKPGEALILASYCPFQHAGPYREYGPVFILAEAEAEAGPRTGAPATLPIGGELPYLGASFVLRAYSAEERIVGAVLATPANAVSQLERLFDEHMPAFALARFVAYGCYALRIEPGSAAR